MDVTVEAQAGLPGELARWPAWSPDERQLAELELLVSGAFRPLTGFMSVAAAEGAAARGTLPDGTPWPFPVTLEVPPDAVPPDADHLVLEDPERTPLAVLAITERTGGPPGTPIRLAGPVTALREPQHGPFRRLRRTPEAVRAELSAGRPPDHAGHGQAADAKPRPVLACVTRRPLMRCQIGQLRHLADEMKARLLLMPAVAGRAEIVEHPEALVRTVLAAAVSLPAETLVVPVPLAPRDRTAAEELQSRALVAAAYGATHLFADAELLRGTGLAAPGRREVPGPRSPDSGPSAAAREARPSSADGAQPPPASPAHEPPEGDREEDMAGTGLGPVRRGTWVIGTRADCPQRGAFPEGALGEGKAAAGKAAAGKAAAGKNARAAAQAGPTWRYRWSTPAIGSTTRGPRCGGPRQRSSRAPAVPP